MSGRIRAGIVGAGYVSAHHARALKHLPFVDVVGIVDIDRARAAELAAQFSRAAVYPTLQAMRAASPDVIHVLTPPAAHYTLACDALELGCHVLIEKPMAETAAECDKLIARARAAGRRVSVNHSARFDPVVQKAASLVRAGHCGDVVAVHFLRSSGYPSYSGGPPPAAYSQGSYPFRDLGVHGLTLFDLFLGAPRDIRVRYYETGRDPLLTFDEWRIEVDCRHGTGYMFLSLNTRPVQNTLIIHGTRGVIHVDRFLQTCQLSRDIPGPKAIGMAFYGFLNAVRQSVRVPLNALRVVTGNLKPSPGIYQGVIEFYDALRAGAPSPISPEQGRDVVAWLERYSVAADREKRERLARQIAVPADGARIVVTGASGFLGRALVERLRAAGDPVRVLLRRRERTADFVECTGLGQVSRVHGSLGQPDVVDALIAGADTVYHLGATKRGTFEQFQEGTLWGTRNVIDACVRHRVKRLVYVSSLSVLDHAGRHRGETVTEASPLEPRPERRGLYTQTKLEAEHMVIDAVRDRNLRAIIIRPGQIIGPGAEQTAPNGAISLFGWWIVAGRGFRLLPLVFRDDVVDALVLAAGVANVANGQIIHVVDPTPITQIDYIGHARVIGQRTVRLPMFVLIAASAVVECIGTLVARRSAVSPYRIRSLEPLHPVDVGLSQRLLQWTPTVGVREGLSRTFNSGNR